MPTQAQTAPDAAAYYAWHHQARERLRYIDAELERLDEEQSKYSLGGPISLTATGGGILLFSALFYLDNQDTRGCDGFTNCRGDDDGTNALLLTGAAVGAALGIVGMIWLTGRLPQRRKLGRQIDEFEQEREELEKQMYLYPEVGTHGGGLRVVGYF